MVVAKHIGRLGNNMFQIAASIGYAKRYGYQWAADSGRGLSEPYSSIHHVFPNLPKAEGYGGMRYHEHNNEFCKLHNRHKDLCHFDYHPIPDMGPNLSLTGFFQSWRYFENAHEEVKAAFPLVDQPNMRDFVSIHIRRGDYLQHSGSFPPVGKTYVEAALERLEDKTLSAIDNLMFFSDDPDWCVQEFHNLPYHCFYSKGKTDLEDLSMMASCGHHIIANSTFSWWAAYLGKNPDRIVISPSHKRGNWFGHSAGVKQDCVDLLPENWVQIEFR